MDEDGSPGVLGVPRVQLCCAALGLVVVTALVHAASPPHALAALAVCVGLAAAVQPLPDALLLAVTAWCLLTGFVVHDAAVLTLAPADLAHLAVLVAAGVLGSRCGARAERPALHQPRAAGAGR